MHICAWACSMLKMMKFNLHCHLQQIPLLQMSVKIHFGNPSQSNLPISPKQANWPHIIERHRKARWAIFFSKGNLWKKSSSQIRLSQELFLVKFSENLTWQRTVFVIVFWQTTFSNSPHLPQNYFIQPLWSINHFWLVIDTVEETDWQGQLIS